MNFTAGQLEVILAPANRRGTKESRPSFSSAYELSAKYKERREKKIEALLKQLRERK
jgi:hypothetical protein